MIVRNIHIPIFDYDIKYLVIESKEDAAGIAKLFRWIQASGDQVTEITTLIKDNAKDGGNHLYNRGLCRSLIVIYKTSSQAEKINTIAHETVHVIDAILETCDMHDREVAAYITGYIHTKLIGL